MNGNQGRPGLPVMTDAVVVVPGIMGSELVDSHGTVRWGLKPSVLARAWLTKRMDSLRVTDGDLKGNRRLRATRLLRVPGYMPMLGGIEPYTGLLDRITAVAVDQRAVIEFPYDWRLSIEFNAAELVTRCEEHLQAWRKVVTAERYTDPNEIRVVIVAHSMGGLVARFASESLGLSTLLRRVITLGTPYYGAVKAVQMLATGEGAPVPRQAARRLAVTSPGVYDLLPRYRCVEDGHGLRPLTTADIVAAGGQSQLADEAAGRWARLAVHAGVRPDSGPVLNAIVGAEQPTMQSVAFDAGLCRFMESLAGKDHRGDSTVYRQAAAPAGITTFPLPQKHGALARSSESLTFIADKLIGADTGPPMGTRAVGVDIPDLIDAGAPLVVRVTGAGGDPVGVTVNSIEVSTGVPTIWAAGVPVEETLRFARSDLSPGLHRVEVKAGGYSAVSDIVLVADEQ
jgi:pimeloyl-ACP methyl ester carboxylesterase